MLQHGMMQTTAAALHKMLKTSLPQVFDKWVDCCKKISFKGVNSEKKKYAKVLSCLRHKIVWLFLLLFRHTSCVYI